MAKNSKDTKLLNVKVWIFHEFSIAYKKSKHSKYDFWAFLKKIVRKNWKLIQLCVSRTKLCTKKIWEKFRRVILRQIV